MANRKVLFFSDAACEGCLRVYPILEQFCKKNDVPFEAYAAGAQKEVFWKYKVRGTPTILIVEDDKEIDRVIGHQNYNSIDNLFHKWDLSK